MRTRPLVADSMLDLIGCTPCVRLHRVVPPRSAEVLAKLESMNPMGSVKDRIGAAMIEAAEKAGKIRPGVTTIIEPTSGNTGIGLAMTAAVKGYKAILTMPESMTVERRLVLLALGASVVLTPKAKGVNGAIAKAQQLVKATPNSWMPAQFDNPANVAIHKRTTAIEVLEATEGRLDAFVAGVGTGGSVTGCGTVLKEKIPGIRIVAAEPADSPVLSGGKPGPNRIQGLGAGFVPAIYDERVVDLVIAVPYEAAIQLARRLAREEGILVGISAGAVCHAAIEVAKELGPGKRVVALMPDLGERYMSHELWTGLDQAGRITDATREDLPAPASTAAPA